MNERQYHLIKVMSKIPVFEGFGLEEIQKLLKACSLQSLSAGQDIYLNGEESNEMLVLLRGKLSVTGESGEELAEIRPGKPIGEMGVFTGEPRSANILAVEDSTVIVFQRQELGALLMTNRDMNLKVLQNLVGILSQRLVQANELNESQARMLRDLERQLDAEEDEEEEEEEEEEEFSA
jgi:CRP-like cAMP-binding protein